MKIPAIIPRPPPPGVVSPPAPSDARKLQESARQFEAVLVRQVLGDALKPVPATPHGQPAPGAEIYQSFMTDAVADGISQSGALGLASLLQGQLVSGSACPPPGQNPVS